MNNKAFTLIEILAAVVIMGLISGTVVVGVNSSITKSHSNYCTSTVDMMTVAGRNYFNDNKTKMPLEIGSRQCVTLKTLQLEKYIDPLKDYQNSSCNVDNSQLCAMKITNNNYYYISKLDCNKCTTENVNKVDSTPKISFTPDGGENSNNKDIIVTMNITDSKNEIVSYSYVVYQITSNGNVSIKKVDYTKYNKDKKITIKINKNGTYYIEGYAYNSVGKRGYKKSGNYNLKYTLNCNNQVKISAKKNGNTKIAEEQWINGTLNMYVEVEGAINSYNVYTSKNSAAFVKENNEFLSRKEKTTVSKKDTGKYKIKVVAYDEQGNSCEITTKDYYLDNINPSCTTKFKDSTLSGKWVNKDVALVVDQCIDKESGCNTNKYPTNIINVSYNGGASAGRVYDKVGNSAICSNVIVQVDKDKPTCNGWTGTNTIWRKSTVSIGLKCNDHNGSGCTAGEYAVKSFSSGTYKAADVSQIITDKAGNTNSCRGTVNVYLDTEPPTKKYGGNVTSGAVTEVVYEDKGEMDNVRYIFKSQRETPSGQSGSWSTTRNEATTCSNTRYVYSKGTDKAGNYTINYLGSYTSVDCCSKTTAQYGGWSACSASCGGGIQSRTITNISDYNSSYCGTTSESQACNTQSCLPINSCNIRGTRLRTASKKWTDTHGHRQYNYYQRYCTDGNGNVSAKASPGSWICSINPYGPTTIPQYYLYND